MTLPLTLAHRRYLQQAAWTAQLRRHIFTRAGLPKARRILEIGCGTGAVLASVNIHSASTFGLDIDLTSLQLAGRSIRNTSLINGDAFHLPFANHSFDISFFHYVLLWLKVPPVALSEARRVTHPGGAVIAFAEPDYSQRLATSGDLARVNSLQMKSLQTQGADPTIGRQLATLFATAGIPPVESGQIAPMPDPLTGQDLDLELEMLKADLNGMVSPAEIDALTASLYETQYLVTFQVPTYYCWGIRN